MKIELYSDEHLRNMKRLGEEAAKELEKRAKKSWDEAAKAFNKKYNKGG